MRRVFVIGIGAGNPDHMTVQAIEALNAADVVFVLDKGPATENLVHIREKICARFITNPAYRVVRAESPERDTRAADYRAGVDAWHGEKARIFAALIGDELREGEAGAFLVWGDPSLYDSTLRILEAVREAGSVEFTYDVIPGISAAQALAAAHRIPLNLIGEAVHFTTGRRLVEDLPRDTGSIVVFLDSGAALEAIPDDGLDIYWGAYLGTGDEVLVSGRLGDVRDEILRIRRAKREEKGWIMDIYLLRRRSP
jgi:precorrin-6A synthase